MFAEILTIGDELTRGEIIDTNRSWLAARLWDQDVTVRWMTSCRDDEADMRRALTEAAGRADLVLCSGGLGPTEDDLTVEVVAGLAGVDVVIDEPARARMEAWLTARRAPVAPIQLRQVRVPAGARVYANAAGLAPGFEVAIAGTPVACMPGVPREMMAIYDDGLAARITALREARGAAPRIAREIFRVFGRGESQISEACRGMVDGVPGASIHYQVKFPETLVKLVVRDPDEAAARARLAALRTEITARLGKYLYGTGDSPLPAVVVRALLEGKRKMATAESCTGGLIGELVTSVSGSSGAFVGGAIVYANDEKVRQLGVRAETLAAHGAVSEEVAREMAVGARERFAVDVACGVTGIAGPDGGSAGKPVGTVWIAVAGPGGVATKLLQWPGTRDQVRSLAAWWALSMIKDAIA